MATDITKLINETEEIIINGKVFLIKELTIRQKMQCISIITDMFQELKNTPTIEELKQKASRLEEKDLLFMNKVFEFSGSQNLLEKEEFLDMTKTQTSKIIEIIEAKNNFFAKSLEKKTTTN